MLNPKILELLLHWGLNYVLLVQMILYLTVAVAVGTSIEKENVY